MAVYAKYTEEFKKEMVQKLLTNPDRSVKSLSMEAGIPISTLKNWKNRNCLNRGNTLSKKKELTPEDKFNIVILTASMSEAEKSEYCRKNGIYSEDIEQWRKDCIAGCEDKSSTKKISKKTERRLEKETKRLKKELIRKEKALAETAALLVLKKKVDALWGDPEDE